MEQIQQALQYMEQGNTELALDLLQEIALTANDDEKFTISQIYMEWGIFDEAREILLELQTKYPHENTIKLLLANIYIDLEDDEEAIHLLNQINEADEEYLQALVQLADLYQVQGLHEVAEQKLLEAKNLAPNEPVIDFALGELAFHSGEYLKCIPFYERAFRSKQSFGDVEVTLRLAEALAIKGEFDDALDYFQSSKSENPDVLFRYGFTAFQANRTDIAIRVWEKLLEEDPYYHSVYPLLAQAYEAEGMLKEAFDIAEKGLKKDEFNKELFHLAGTLAHKLNKKDEAYRYVQQAISIDPGYKEAILFLVEAYKKDEDYEKVIELLTHILEFGEEDGMYFWELARAFNELESYNESLKYYQDAYNALKDDSDFLKEYGYFLIEEGRIKQAKEILSNYLVKEPSDTEVEELITRFGNNE